MKKHFLLHIIASVLATIGLAACTDDNELPASFADEEGKVIINYSTTAVQTRSGEEPWGEPWYEMKLNRLDLFLFDESGALLHHYGNSVTQSRQGTFSTDLTAKQVTDFNPASCYLVANCPSVADKQSLAELQAAVIDPSKNDPVLNYNQKQELFVMTAMLTRADIVHGGTNSTKDITMNFQLERVAAKIVLTINGGGSVNGMSYRMFNYATQARVLPPSDADEYTKVVAEAEEDGWLASTPTMTELSDNADNIHMQGVAKEVVFYSYPTDWFDTSTITHNADGTYTIANMYTKAPILDDKECYILLEAPYEGKRYHYKIPLNYRLPDYNDKKTLTEAEYWEVRDLYRLQRNHVYRILATVDVEGGLIDDPQQPALTVKVLNWTTGEYFNLKPDDFVEP